MTCACPRVLHYPTCSGGTGAAWGFTDSRKVHVVEYDAAWAMLRIRPATPLEREQAQAYVLYRVAEAP